MKVEKIDHIAISVSDLDKAMKFFSDLLGTEFSKPRVLEAADAKQTLDPLGIELVAPLTPNGSVAKTIERKGEGLSLLSLKVENLDEAIAEMQSKGVRLVQIIQGHPRRRAAIFHPKDVFGVMIELIEYKPKHPIISLNLERE